MFHFSCSTIFHYSYVYNSTVVVAQYCTNYFSLCAILKAIFQHLGKKQSCITDRVFLPMTAANCVHSYSTAVVREIRPRRLLNSGEISALWLYMYKWYKVRIQLPRTGPASGAVGSVVSDISLRWSSLQSEKSKWKIWLPFSLDHYASRWFSRSKTTRMMILETT